MRIPDLIAKKRDNLELDPDEIKTLVKMVTNGEIEPAQIGALMMAIYINGMSLEETAVLTNSMMLSGRQLEWPRQWRHLVVDKHSTGGVGDKVSLPLAPALAACGLKVPMISGRGLGHTGGTVDKLESVPGVRCELPLQTVVDIVSGEVGCCIVGQNRQLAPADKILYAVRDVTATTDSMPLIAASILCKKASEGLSALVMDIKCGRGAFLRTEEDCRALAKVMCEVGKRNSLKVIPVLTDMDAPIGYTIGNVLEIQECIECLRGKGPKDLTELVCTLGGVLLHAASKVDSVDAGKTRIQEVLGNNEAMEKFKAMLVRQGAEVETVARLCDRDESSSVDGVLPRAREITSIDAQDSGYVSEINSYALAHASVSLGAGRAKGDDLIDVSVGLTLLVTIGDYVKKGSPWIKIHHNHPLKDAVKCSIAGALTVTQEKIVQKSRIIEIMST